MCSIWVFNLRTEISLPVFPIVPFGALPDYRSLVLVQLCLSASMNFKYNEVEVQQIDKAGNKFVQLLSVTQSVKY